MHRKKKERERERTAVQKHCYKKFREETNITLHCCCMTNDTKKCGLKLSVLTSATALACKPALTVVNLMYSFHLSDSYSNCNLSSSDSWNHAKNRAVAITQ